jgi:cytochrome c2
MKVTFTFNFPWALKALVICLVGAAACSAASVPPVASADARWASERWPGTTVAELSKGRDVFVSRCSACHALPHPEVKSPDEWSNVLDEMAARAKLSSADRDLALRYLSAASQRLRASAASTAGSS